MLMATASRLQRRLEKSVFNPAFRVALRFGIAPPAFALLETIGRRSGKPRLTPVGNGLDGGVFWLVSERGRRGGYVKNLVAKPRVRVKVGRRWYPGTAAIIDDDDAHARRRRLDAANGLFGRADGVIFRASATIPVTVRIDLIREHRVIRRSSPFETGLALEHAGVAVQQRKQPGNRRRGKPRLGTLSTMSRDTTSVGLTGFEPATT
jgi:deazaflavin-dependent oxidoreductase (nitroreductase family)